MLSCGRRSALSTGETRTLSDELEDATGMDPALRRNWGCGFSLPSVRHLTPMRKWWRRYQALGQAGLIEQSRAPLRPEALILDLRRRRSLGVKRLRNELIRQHDLQLSL